MRIRESFAHLTYDVTTLILLYVQLVRLMFDKSYSKLSLIFLMSFDPTQTPKIEQCTSVAAEPCSFDASSRQLVDEKIFALLYHYLLSLSTARVSNCVANGCFLAFSRCQIIRVWLEKVRGGHSSTSRRFRATSAI